MSQKSQLLKKKVKIAKGKSAHAKTASVKPVVSKAKVTSNVKAKISTTSPSKVVTESDLVPNNATNDEDPSEEAAVHTQAKIPADDILQALNSMEERFALGKIRRETIVGEVVDLIDNVFIFHGDASLYIRMATFLWNHLAQYNATFLDVCQRLAGDALELDPTYAEAAYWQGRFFDFREDFANSSAAFEKALALKPDTFHYLTALGLLYGKQQRFVDSIKTLFRAIEVNPDQSDITAIVNLSSSYLGYEKPDLALKWIKKGIDINPSEGAYLQEAFLLAETNDHDAALQSLEKALELNPSNAITYERMSDSYMAMENMDRCKECLDEALKLSPDNVQVLNRLGQFAMAHARDHDEALTYFRKALQLSPQDSLTYNNMGILYSEAGDNEKARQYYLQAIKLAPHAADPRLNLASMLNQEGNVGEAMATLKGFTPKLPREKELVEQILETMKAQLKAHAQSRWDIDE